MRASAEIDALIASLVDAGIAPKYVSRLAAELQDHLSDLETEAQRFGLPEEDVQADAEQRLGASAAIANEFAKRPELVSWIHASPWLQPVLRAAAWAEVSLSAPVRFVADSHATMLRYAAATAAATILTAALLLALIAVLTPNDRLVWTPPPGSPQTGPVQTPATVAQTGPVQAATPPHADATRSTSYEAAAATPGASILAEMIEVTETVLPKGLVTAEAMHPPPVRLAWADSVAMPRPKIDNMTVAISFTFDFPARGSEFRSIVKPEPEYPLNAVRRGLEGYVVVEYTVTENGSVAKAFIVESSNSVFHRAALEAASRLRYPPRVIRGQPINVEGVRTLIRFQLDV